jgi:hypothetical protein
VYKAVHRESGEEVLTLHPTWRGRKDELRKLTSVGLLVCQSCHQAVRLKAGPRKRPHFAHQHLQGCSYGQESPRILAGRALLYEWLAALCPGQVEAEIILPGLQRPADILLHRDGKDGGDVVIWVVDALMKQQARIELRAVFEQCRLRPVWVLLAHLLRIDTNHPSRLYLSPSERDWLRQTAYDEIGRENHLAADDFGCSLHYLDIDTARMTTWRSLERVHAPNVFTGRREECLLDQLRIDLAGELAHPGEERDLTVSRKARLRQAERVARWLEPAARVQLPGMPPPALSGHTPGGHPWGARSGSLNGEELNFTEFLDTKGAQKFQEKDFPALEGEGRGWVKGACPPLKLQGEGMTGEAVTCIYCGEITQDWWAVWSEDGKRLGKCRACLERGSA